MGYKYILETTPNDISKLTEKELRARVRALADVANKRMKRYEQAPGGIPYSPAYARAAEGGYFRTGGKSLNQLRAEYKRAYSYLTAETSTQAGAKRVENRVRARLDLPKNISLKDYWTNYEKAQSNFPYAIELFGSETVQQKVSEWIKNGDDINQKMAELINEEAQQDYDYPDFVDEIFSGNA